MKSCGSCNNLKIHINTTYKGSTEYCLAAEKKGINVSNFNKDIFFKNCVHYEPIDYKMLKRIRDKDKKEYNKKVKKESNKMSME